MALECIIVDDEPAALNLVKSYVEKTGFLQLKGCFHNPVEALEFAISNSIALLFLDINMPDISGIDLSKMLPAESRVIFTTAYEQYAIEGYKVSALDYLLKPFSYEEFLAAALKAKQHFQDKKTEISAADHIYVKADYKLQKVAFDELLFVEGMKDYVRFHFKNGQKLMSLMSMKKLEEVFPESFMRVHRSYIVKLDAIDLVERNRIVIGKEYIPVAENYRESFKQYMDQKTVGGKQ